MPARARTMNDQQVAMNIQQRVIDDFSEDLDPHLFHENGRFLVAMPGQSKYPLVRVILDGSSAIIEGKGVWSREWIEDVDEILAVLRRWRDRVGSIPKA